MKLSVSQVILEALKAEGVKNVFGVSGSDTLPVLDVISRESNIKYIQTQNEQSAIYMANGYARGSLQPGICIVSSGPGITHCVSGMVQALYTSTPSILIGAEERTKYHGMGDSLHHEVEAVPIMKPATKLSLKVERADRVMESMRKAFRAALSGKKGPVYLGIPKDMFKDETEAEVLAPYQYRVLAPPPADPDSITRAAELLVAAKTPVALAGGGLAAAQGQGLLLELAELLGMPVASTRNNKGIVSEEHPLALGTVGQSSSPVSVQTMQAADVVLTIGSTLDEQTTQRFGYKVLPKTAKIIQVDIDPMEIGKIFPIELGLCGDAGCVLRSLIQEVKKRKIDRRPVERLPRIKELLKRKKEWQEALAEEGTSSKIPIQFPRLLKDLRKALPRDAIVAAASGGTNMWFDYAFQSLAHNYAIGSWHPLGAEFPESMGVKVANPNSVVVCFTGDGSLMETVQEIVTAATYNIAVLLVIAHNGVFGNMRYDQIERYGSRFVGTEPHIPNLTNVAREFGAYSERVENPDDIAPAVGRALASGRPALLEIMMDVAPENLVPPINPIKLGL